jgi:hypothetical protein
MSQGFNLPQEISGSVGDGFAASMFFGCSGDNFEMSQGFNLPQEISGSVGREFASSMFFGCSGEKFTMVDGFNLSQDITQVSDGFAYRMFSECYGDAFNMSAVFTLPQGITSILLEYSNPAAVGEVVPQGGYEALGFAFEMFKDCNGSLFTMNAVFNLPQSITSIEIYDNFAASMFSGCSGSSFLINDEFKFQHFAESFVDIDGVFEKTFYGVTNTQTRIATSIINGNDPPTTGKQTFSNVFTDYDSLSEHWKAPAAV